MEDIKEIFDKCPVCRSAMDMTERELSREKSIMAYAPISGHEDYFGERQEEYCSSGYGDLYRITINKSRTYKCPRCGYQNSIPVQQTLENVRLD